MRMILSNIKTILLLLGLVPVLLFGCAEKNPPRETVLRFVKAVQASDRAELENVLSFERLLAEKDGEKYLMLPQAEKSLALSRFKEAMLNGLTTGGLRYFGQIDPVVRDERISGDKSEIVIYERKNKNKAYMFTLFREGGVWKINRIIAL